MNTIKKNMKALLAMVLFMTLSLTGLAQENPGKDPLQEFFFPPELVMRYQNEILLTKEQKEMIISTMEEAQKKFTRLQWDLQAEMTALQKLLSEQSVNEANVLTQLDKVLDQERIIKRAQISLMVKIKNALTEDQKVKLTALRGQ